MATKIYIESRALVADHFSGIGHYVLGITKAMDDYIGSSEHTELQLTKKTNYKSFILVPKNQLSRLSKFMFSNFKFKSLPIPARFIDKLLVNGLIPPIDLLFGKGIYLFTNFSRYPLLRSKSATVIYDITFEAVPQYVDANNRRFLSAMVKKSVKYSDIVITISEHAKSELVKLYGVPKNKIVIAYPGVDRSIYYKRSKGEIDAVKFQYKLPDNYTLFVGNVEPRKNIDGLIDAYVELPLELCKKHPLVIIGASGWLTDEIFNKIDMARQKGYPIIRPSKYVLDADMPAIYSGAKALVYPSHYEGFGMPPVEAMACGVPVICADNSSLPEAVGKAAIMIDSADKNSITQAMSKLLTQESTQQELITEGYKQVKKFSWNTSAEIIYKELIKL